MQAVFDSPSFQSPCNDAELLRGQSGNLTPHCFISEAISAESIPTFDSPLSTALSELSSSIASNGMDIFENIVVHSVDVQHIEECSFQCDADDESSSSEEDYIFFNHPDDITVKDMQVINEAFHSSSAKRKRSATYEDLTIFEVSEYIQLESPFVTSNSSPVTHDVNEYYAEEDLFILQSPCHLSQQLVAPDHYMIDVCAFERKKQFISCEKILQIIQTLDSTRVIHLPETKLPLLFNRKKPCSKKSWTSIGHSSFSMNVLSFLGAGSFGHAILAEVKELPKKINTGSENLVEVDIVLRVFKVDRDKYSVIWELFILTLVAEVFLCCR